MTFDQLQIFIAIAEREHITRAADAPGLAPPSVSAAVASLERELRTKLFHRVGRGIVVTEGGKLLLDEARPPDWPKEAFSLCAFHSSWHNGRRRSAPLPISPRDDLLIYRCARPQKRRPPKVGSWHILAN